MDELAHRLGVFIHISGDRGYRFEPKLESAKMEDVSQAYKTHVNTLQNKQKRAVKARQTALNKGEFHSCHSAEDLHGFPIPTYEPPPEPKTNFYHSPHLESKRQKETLPKEVRRNFCFLNTGSGEPKWYLAFEPSHEWSSARSMIERGFRRLKISEEFAKRTNIELAVGELNDNFCIAVWVDWETSGPLAR